MFVPATSVRGGYDSTSDGSHNYLVDSTTGTVYQTARDFTNPMALFTASGSRILAGNHVRRGEQVTVDLRLERYHGGGLFAERDTAEFVQYRTRRKRRVSTGSSGPYSLAGG